jgi:GNAT superfamily N-acetyltransferase
MTPADHQGIATLFEEMQAHYAVFCPPRETILAGLREMPGGAEMLIAEENGGITGFAAFSAIYPGPGLKPGVFLKELYVSKDYRGKGLGRQIMKALGALALERKLSRIDWTADTDNLSLLSFYDDIGGSRKTGKLFYRLEGQALTDLAT